MHYQVPNCRAPGAQQTRTGRPADAHRVRICRAPGAHLSSTERAPVEHRARSCRAPGAQLSSTGCAAVEHRARSCRAPSALLPIGCAHLPSTEYPTPFSSVGNISRHQMRTCRAPSAQLSSTVCASVEHRVRICRAPCAQLSSTVCAAVEHRVRSCRAPCAQLSSTVCAAVEHHVRCFRAPSAQLPIGCAHLPSTEYPTLFSSVGNISWHLMCTCRAPSAQLSSTKCTAVEHLSSTRCTAADSVRASTCTGHPHTLFSTVGNVFRLQYGLRVRVGGAKDPWGPGEARRLGCQKCHQALLPYNSISAKFSLGRRKHEKSEEGTWP